MVNYGLHLTAEYIKENVKRFMYVKDRNGAQIGLVVCDKKGNFGWSLYNKEKEWREEAELDKGLQIALSRAKKGKDYVDSDLTQRIVRFFTIPKYINNKEVCKLGLVREYLNRLQTMVEKRNNRG